MQAEAFLLKYLRQSFNRLSIPLVNTWISTGSQSPQTERCVFTVILIQNSNLKNIFTVEKGFNIEMKTCKFLSGYISNVHMMTKNNTFLYQ